MENIIIIRNKSTGKTSEVPHSTWKKIRYSQKWGGLFERVHVIKDPPEVLALKAKKAAQKEVK